MTATLRPVTVVSVLCSIVFVAAAQAESRSVRLLPDDTVAYWVASDVSKLAGRIEQMDLWGVEKSPTFQTVMRHFEETHLQRWSGRGVTWRDVLKNCTGEACLAVRKTKNGSPSTILLAEIDARPTSNLLSALEPLSKVVFEDIGGKFGTDLKLYFNPADGVQFLYFVKDGLFVAVGDDDSPAMLLSSWPGENALMKLKAHQKVMERCAVSNIEAPDVRWFIKPVEYVGMSVPRDKFRPKSDLLNFLARAKGAGFDALEAIGGTLNLAEGPNAFVARTMIYAPNRKTPVMRITPLPNGDWHAPPQWTPLNLQGFTSFSWSLRDASKGLADFIDNLVGAKGSWNDILKAILLDPAGPQVDWPNHLIPHVGGKVFVLSGQPTSDDGVTGRGLVAIELSDEQTVAKTINTMMDHDPDAESFDVGRDGFWIVDSDNEHERLVELASAHNEFETFAEEQKVPLDTERKWLDSYYVGVANGYLIIGDNKALLKQVLASEKGFRDDGDFQRVRLQLQLLLPDPVSLSSFSRHADDFRVEARLAWLIPKLNQSWEPPLGLPPGPSAADSPNVKWSPSLGPGGWAAKREKDGWFAVAIAQPSASDIRVVTETPVTQVQTCVPTRCCRVRRPLLRCKRMRFRRCRR